MQLRQLEMLCSVLRRGSLSGAAAELGVTQPAVSMQMKALAEELGLALFEGHGRGLKPTPAAEAMAGYGERILRLAEDALSAARLGVREASVVRVAASSTPGAALPERIAAFHQRTPETRVRLEVRNSRAVEARVASGQADLGVIGGPRTDGALRSEHWCDDELVVITAPDHPLARRRRLRASDLGGETLLVRELGSATRATLESAFLRAHLALPESQVLGDTEGLKNAVAAGLGVACVSPLSIVAELAAGRLTAHCLRDVDLKRPLSILLRGGPVSEPVQNFVSFLQARPARAPSLGRRS